MGFESEPQSDTQTLPREDISVNFEADRELDEGDHERFSHFVRKDQIVESAVTGKPVIALCGKKWVPNRDPQKFPICPTCKEIHSGLPKGPSS